MRALSALSSLSLLLAALGIAHARSTCIDYRTFVHPTGFTGAPPAFDATFDGEIVYLASGSSGLITLDVSDASRPSILAQVPTFNAYDVDVTDGIAVLADELEGLKIFDVSNPSVPTLVGQLTSIGSADDLVRVGDLVYFTNPNGFATDMVVVDVSDPMSPFVERTVAGVTGYDLKVDGARCYLLDRDRVLTLDVSDPANPTLLGSSEIVLQSGFLWSLEAAESRVFVADFDGEVAELDVSDPDEVRVIRSFVAEFDEVARSSPQLRVGGMNLVGTTLILSTSSPEVWDVPTSGPWVRKGVINVGGRGPLARSGTQLVVAQQPAAAQQQLPNGIWTVDLGGGDFAPPFGSLAVGGDGVAADGDRVIVGNTLDETLTAIDVSDLSAPSAGLEFVSPHIDFALDGDQAVVLRATELEVIDVSNPNAPASGGILAFSGAGSVVDADGGLALVAAGPEGCHVIDVSGPGGPSLITTIPTVGNPVDVALDAGRALVVDPAVGVLVFDVSTPQTPILLSTVSEFDLIAPASLTGVSLRDNRALVTWRGCRQGGCQSGADVLSLTDPANVVVTRIDFGGAGDLDGGTIYLEQGILIDVSDSANPVRAGQFEFSSALAIGGTYFVTSSAGILRIRPLQCEDETPVSIEEVRDPAPEAPAVRLALRVAPNPFNPVTTVRLAVPGGERARLAIYDARGREVDVLFEGFAEDGERALVWRPGEGASGVYFIRLETENRVVTEKVTLLK